MPKKTHPEVLVIRADVNVDLADLITVVTLAEKLRDSIRMLANVTNDAPLQGLVRHYDAVIGRVDRVAFNTLREATGSDTKKIEQFKNGIRLSIEGATV